MNALPLSPRWRSRARIIAAVLGGFGGALAGFAAPESVVSPDGHVALRFEVVAGRPTYHVDYRGRPALLPAGLGFLGEDLTYTLGTLARREQRGQWSQVWGERREVPENYRELRAELRASSGRRLVLVLRAYDEGAAWRWEYPSGQPEAELRWAGERTEFLPPAETYAYEEHGTEGEYRRVPVTAVQPDCERPLTLAYAAGFYGAIGEAGNLAYPRLLLSPDPSRPGRLVSALGGTTANTTTARMRHDPSIRLRSGEATPWRYLLLGRRPGELLERNYLLLNLNPPCALPDTAWIRPGKVMRDSALTTANALAVVDFARTGGIDYVLFDSGWYGTEDAARGDATRPALDPQRRGNCTEPIDLPAILRYARTRQVGVILYVDRRQMKRQREQLLALYRDWGVAGIKIGFVDVGPQTETAWLTETIALAAAHRLMVNVHDGWRANGLHRTYPNLMTVEGIRGNEHMPTAEHNATLPFTRFLAGPGDYTVCYYDRRNRNTHAHQLALGVIAFSPWQCLYWYDRPALAHDEPELEFFRRLPTVWDETTVLLDEIGRAASLARRRGDDWFIGTIVGAGERTVSLPLTFLAPGRRYRAHLYEDDASMTTATQVRVRTLTVEATNTLTAHLRATGGQAVWLEALPR